jgi:hypothetical protein
MSNSKSYVLFDIERRTFVGGGDPIFFSEVAEAEHHADRLAAMEEYRPEPRQFDVVAVRAT